MSNGGSDGNDEAMRDMLSLLDYLAELDALRHSPVKNIADYKGLFRLDKEDIPDTPGISVTPNKTYWLEIDFVDPPHQPKIPEQFQEFVDFDEYSRNHTSQEPPKLDIPEDRAEDLESLYEEYYEWISSVWEDYVNKCKIAAGIKKKYKELFEAQELLKNERESYELVWGFGILVGDNENDGKVYHPLLTVPLGVERSDDKNEIGDDKSLLVYPTGAVNVESTFLSGVDLADKEGFERLKTRVSDQDIELNLWDEAQLRDFLRSMVRSIDHDGGLQNEIGSHNTAYYVKETWTLFLRRRRTDYKGFLDKLKVAINQGALSEALRSIVTSSSRQSDEAESSEGNSDEALLLPLPYNKEQERVIRLAQDNTGVIVQGPPGTGKSHTIANIISHNLAHGRRILVLAEKEQALKVIQDKIPSEISPLVMSLLGSSEKSSKSQDSSVEAIWGKVNKLKNRSFEDQNESITDLIENLDKIKRDISMASHRLMSVCEAETTILEGTYEAGERLTPSLVAEWLSTNSLELGIIPDKIAFSTLFPFTNNELENYISLLRDIDFLRAEYCVRDVPNSSKIPTYDQIQELFNRLKDLSATIEPVSKHINSKIVNTVDTKFTSNLISRIREEINWLERAKNEWATKFRLRISDAIVKDKWSQFLDNCQEKQKSILRLFDQVAGHEITFEDSGQQFENYLKSAYSKLSKKDKLGIFSISERRAVRACSLNGNAPTSSTDVELCLSRISLSKERVSLARLWASQASQIEMPLLTSDCPEEEIGYYLEILDNILFKEDSRQTKLISLILKQGIHTDDSFSITDLKQIVNSPIKLNNILEILDVFPEYREYEVLSNDLGDLREYLQIGPYGNNTSPLWKKFSDALNDKSISKWKESHNELTEILKDRKNALKLLELHGKLANQAPTLACDIEKDLDSIPGFENFERCWEWSRLNSWLQDILANGNSLDIQDKIKDLQAKKQQAMLSLVSEASWSYLVENFDFGGQEVMSSYLDAKKKLGKGKSKYIDRKRKNLADALSRAIQVIPAWVMPVHQALSSFRPGETLFDILIIDEASQLGLEAIPVFCLAKKVIVVGDKEQVSPTNTGLYRAAVHSLMDEHLQDIDNFNNLFDPDSSLYELCEKKFGNLTMLREHFRSLPEIIRFSNNHIYEGKIEPLRDGLPMPGWKPLGSIFVRDGYRDGDKNLPEAHVVVNLLEELYNNPEYDGKTFGIVTLLGTAQAKEIFDLIVKRESLGARIFEERKLLIGDPARFQGDERDVVIISLVVAPDGSGSLPSANRTRRSTMTDEQSKRRINVAASRARDQMWVVHSVEPSYFHEDDLRKDLITHCRTPSIPVSNSNNLLEQCESKFEELVLQRILDRGYTQVQVQYEVAGFRIDIVIVGPDFKLAIECDGDRWHGPKRWHADWEREQKLKRAGWTFIRIRGSEFFRYEGKALEPLWKMLKELNIPPGDDWFSECDQNTVREVDGAGFVEDEDSEDGDSDDEEPDDDEEPGTNDEPEPPDDPTLF